SVRTIDEDQDANGADPGKDAGDVTIKPEITLADLDFLKPSTVTENGRSIVAVPLESDPTGSFAFVLPRGANPKQYTDFATFLAGSGWKATLYPEPVTNELLESEHTPDQCTVIGGLGGVGKPVLDYGYQRRGSVDGAILVGFVREDSDPYKKKLPIVLISGEQDRVAPYDEMAAQYSIYPAQTYLLKIGEANHSGYYDAVEFDEDGQAQVTPAHQRLILAEVISNMMDRLCLSRETKLADEARAAERERQRQLENGDAPPNADGIKQQ
ncbi:MAG: hypothetical protein AAF668_08410, partial [Pseudomonadota bacterium]